MGTTTGTKQRWTCNWQGAKISVRVDASGSEVTHRLLLNGKVIDREETPRRQPVYLCARAKLRGKSRIIEAPLHPLSCKIYVDAKQVGGDEVVFHVPEPPLWEKTRERGRIDFLMRRGAKPALVVAAAVIGSLVLWGRSATHAIGVGTLSGALIAVVQVDSVWHAAEKQYQLRLKKLNDPAWQPELPPGRRLASLLLIAVGSLLLAATVLFFLLWVASEEDQAVLLAFGCLVPTLGAFYAARNLRQREGTGSQGRR